MENPYESPSTFEVSPGEPSHEPISARIPEHLSLGKKKREPAISPAGTLVPRHIAAILDNFFALVLCILVAKQFPEEGSALPVIAAVFTYLAYYFLSEAAVCATPGKLLMGLKVVGYDGERCRLKQIAVRTLFRVLEVNPFLLGSLPAAIRIISSRDKQRFGDYVADTVVVFR